MSFNYITLFVAAILVAAIPYAMLLGVGSVVGPDAPIGVAHGVALLVGGFLVAYGALWGQQRQRCAQVNGTQVLLNALLATACIALGGVLPVLIPWLGSLVSGLLPQTLDPAMLRAVAQSYWVLWGALFGVGLGGVLTGSCGD